MGGEVERDAQALLAGRDVLSVERVALLHRAEARVLRAANRELGSSTLTLADTKHNKRNTRR